MAGGSVGLLWRSITGRAANVIILLIDRADWVVRPPARTVTHRPAWHASTPRMPMRRLCPEDRPGGHLRQGVARHT